MDAITVKKIVAVCFLEAVKMALEHLGTYRMEQEDRGANGPGEVTRVYGCARRLRDYLQSRISASGEEVRVVLVPDDRGLLVAACRRYVDIIDDRLTLQLEERERRFLTKKREVISEWALELAALPLVDLPLPPISLNPLEGGHLLRMRLERKLHPRGEQSLIVAGEIRSFGPDGNPEAPQPGAATAGGAPAGAHDLDGGSSFMPSGMESVAIDDDSLLTSSALRDPRLRALVAMDLRSFYFALENGDYRIATVLLTSILEAAVLDYAIPRRGELGLSGSPDTWCPQEVLLDALGNAAKPPDREFVYRMFFARNLLKPAYQIVTPTVATAMSVQRTREFVELILYQLGYRTAHRAAATMG